MPSGKRLTSRAGWVATIFSGPGPAAGVRGRLFHSREAARLGTVQHGSIHLPWSRPSHAGHARAGHSAAACAGNADQNRRPAVHLLCVVRLCEGESHEGLGRAADDDRHAGMYAGLRRNRLGSGTRSRTQRQGRLRSRGSDGRRPGQRQENRFDHHGNGRERWQGRVRLPCDPAGAGPVHTGHPRCRLRTRGRAECRPRPRPGGGCGSQAHSRPAAPRADRQRRMDDERAGLRRDQTGDAQLHGLPHVAADFRVAEYRGRLPQGVRADGRLLSRGFGPAAAAAGRRAPASAGAGRRRAEIRRISREHQPEWTLGASVRDQAASAPQGPRHQGRHHGIRSAAEGDPAP